MTAEAVGFTSTASSEVLNQITNSLNISKLNDSVFKEKDAKSNSSYDISSQAYLPNKKNMRASDNFRQDST
jgi:hypothetical protein